MPKKIDKLLADAIITNGLLGKEEAESLLKEISISGLSLYQILISRSLIPEKNILTILAEKLNLNFIDLKKVTIDKPVIDKIPVRIALYYKFIPLGIRERTLSIAVSYPLDIQIQDEIRTQIGLDINMVLACQEDIAEALKKYYGLAADTLEKITQTLSVGKAIPQASHSEAVEDIEKLAGDASVIKLVNQIILEGWKKRSTDIHIEPYRESVALRYRVDGILYDSPVPPEIKNFLSAIISRIKIMSNLNIVERRLPQDGRAVVKVQDQVLDLRISTIPTPHGESVVIRILPTKMLFSLEKLGLPKRDFQTFQELIQKPHGIVFVTGPTGSGKTTTLYACLSRINTKDRKIITIEDPIEYEMSGITQIQVLPEIGLDFARGLRSILRHDPDVIMVGEVRDLETAEIAIRVALTGHLVFSTLHTNDAASGITRLLDIGVEPFLLASSVEAFIAQRLIRVICPDCKYLDESASAELKKVIAEDLGLQSADKIKIYRGKGCNTCNHTGFFGRTAIYEILLIDDKIRDLIISKSSSEQIKKIAIIKGMHTLRQDGWQKVTSGVTTPEEVMKVTPLEENSDRPKKSFIPEAESADSEPYSPLPSEKRIYLRLNSKANIRYRIIKSKEELSKKIFNPEQLTVTKNISAGGLLFIAQESVAVSSIIELNIELPDGQEAIDCLAKVIRVEHSELENNYNIAVCFLDITGAQRTRLNKFVDKEYK